MRAIVFFVIHERAEACESNSQSMMTVIPTHLELTMHLTQLRYWLAALHLPGIGSRSLFRWLTQFTDMEHLFNAYDSELKAAGLTNQQISTLRHPNWRLIEADLEWAQKENHHLIAFPDAQYPPLLKEIDDPPLLLYVIGNQQALQQIQIAIVGSRHATSPGMKNAEQFAYSLAKAGIAVTSGLALGIDGASHRGALAAKGVTLGIFGTGLCHVYPSSHRELAAEIVRQQGALVSEFPLSTMPYSANFPRRNRIIGGLSVGVLVVEAALKSGSLITAKHALNQGRDVFAIPGSIHHPLTKGCHALIKQGAKLVEKAEDILEEIKLWHANFTNPVTCMPTSLKGLSPIEERIFQQIGYEITPIDMIIWRSGLTPKEVSSILLILELNGYIQSSPGGYIRAVLT